MEKDIITLAYAPDNKQANLALVSMTSVLENTNSNVEILITHSNLTKENIELFEELKKYKNCTITFEKINDEEFENFPVASWVTVQTWYRIKLPLLKPNIDKIIYLDCDTLVVGDIKEFYDIDISQKLIAGVEDVWLCKDKIKNLDINDNIYFNAGVLLINCKKWREENIFEKIKNYSIDNKDKLTASDQDAINKIADNDKISLHQKFNYLETWWRNYYHEYENDAKKTYQEAKENPLIIHFTAYKPSSLTSKHSYKNTWWEFAKKTNIYIDLLENYKKEADKYYLEEHKKTRADINNEIKQIEQAIAIIKSKS